MPTFRILVVDDDADITTLLANLLIDAGFAADAAWTAATARERLASEKFHAAIIDCMLARDDGIALARFASERGTPVVLMSGNPTLMQKLPEAGFVYLWKPFRADELLRAIGEAVRASLGAAAD
jgi:two-component system OmpR family response regulator